MSKHTPGPWKVNSYGQIQTPEGTFRIKVVVALPCSKDDVLANTKLISAAPDLLEALEEIISSGELPFCYSSPLVIKANYAIAKARGEKE